MNCRRICSPLNSVGRGGKGFEAEITGRKRFQTVTRGRLGPVEFNGTRFVINPLWNWTLDDLRHHIEAHALPRHPLVEDGFVSIGCMPCTARVAPGGDYRSGRWAGNHCSAAATACGAWPEDCCRPEHGSSAAAAAAAAARSIAAAASAHNIAASPGEAAGSPS